MKKFYYLHEGKRVLCKSLRLHDIVVFDDDDWRVKLIFVL